MRVQLPGTGITEIFMSVETNHLKRLLEQLNLKKLMAETRTMADIKADIEKEQAQLLALHEEQNACLQRLIDLKCELLEVSNA